MYFLSQVHFFGTKVKVTCEGQCQVSWSHFYAPALIDRGHIVFDPAICLLVCFFVRKNFYIVLIFWSVRVKAFMFHVSIPCDKIFLLVPSSWSSVKVKVKYQGHSFLKNGRCWGIGVWQKHLISRMPFLGDISVFKPFPKGQIVDSSKLKEFADKNFRFDDNSRKFSK